MASAGAKLFLLLKSAASNLQSFWADPLRLLISVLIVFAVILLYSVLVVHNIRRMTQGCRSI